MTRRSVGERIDRLASAARPAAPRKGISGSDVLDLRFYVRDADHSMGGEVIALDGAGKPMKDSGGNEIALPLAAHEDAAEVLQAVLDLIQDRRMQRRAQTDEAEGEQ